MTPHTRPPVELDERRCFTPMQKAKMFMRAKRRCELCGVRIMGTWIAGHITPWALGGRTELDNARVECRSCARGTHAEDTSTAAKCERMSGRRGQYARRVKNGPTLKSRKTNWPKRKFQSRKAWKKEMEQENQ